MYKDRGDSQRKALSVSDQLFRFSGGEGGQGGSGAGNLSEEQEHSADRAGMDAAGRKSPRHEAEGAYPEV